MGRDGEAPRRAHAVGSAEEPVRAHGEARRRPPRREPLPETAPKPSQDDAAAPERVRRIIESPTYLPADEDPGFLRVPEVRAVRLQLDYAKAETYLRANGVRHTIVVFGSTRIPEPSAAQRRLEACRAACAARPDDADCRRHLAIAERIVAKSRYYDIARELGRIVGREGDAPAEDRIVIATGGGPGLMEAANRGAFDVGAKSVGFNVTLPHEQFPNPYVTPELCFRFHYFAMRKLHFLQRARALVAFPGGFGTFDELFETLTLVQTRTIAPLPIVLVGRDYWRQAFDVDFLVDEGTIDPEDAEIFSYAETAQEVWDGIERWYERAG